MFRVTNLWDTVYAFLSLAHNGGEIKVDYQRPLVHVLAEAVWKAIDASKSVDILCRPWAPTRREIVAWNAKTTNTNQDPAQQSQTQRPSWIRDTTLAYSRPEIRLLACNMTGSTQVYSSANPVDQSTILATHQLSLR